MRRCSRQLALPDEVREVIGKRIAQLPAACVDVLRWAAALGQRFRVCELARATERDHDALLGLLQTAADARIVCEDQLGVYRFAHPLIREALHQSVRMPERARLHQRIGEVIEARGGSGDSSRYEELAYHFCEAAAIGSAEKAVDYAERAASRALAATAHETAVEYFEKALHALELMTPLDLLRAAELRLQLGQALRAAREDPARVRSVFVDVAEIGQGAQRRRAVRARGARLRRPEPVALSRHARSRHGRSGRSLTARAGACLAARRAIAPCARSRSASSRWRCTTRASASAASSWRARRSRWRGGLAEPNTLAQVMLLQHRVITAPDQLDERLALTSEILSLTQVMELRDLELDAHVQRAFLLLQKGQLVEAEADMAASVRLAEEIQQPDEKDWARRFATLRLFWEGRFDEAERESLAMVEKYAHRGMQNPDQGHLIRVLVARWLQGKVGREHRHAGRARGQVSAAGGVALLDRFDVRVHRPDRDGAARARSPRGTRLRGLALRPQLAELPHAPGDRVLPLHDRERAALVYRALEPFADRIILLGHASSYSGPVSHPLAAVATTLERWDEAEHWFEQAIASNTAFGATVWTPLVQVDYADMLLRRGSPGDRRRAQALLDAALVTAREFGLGEVLERGRRAFWPHSCV